MTSQGGNRSSGDWDRSRGDPPPLSDAIEKCKKQLGISDDDQALTDEQKQARLVAEYTSRRSLGRDTARRGKDTEWVVDGLLSRGGVHLLAGSPKKSMKSLLCLDMALSIVSGSAFLGLPTRKLPVIYMNFEDGDDIVSQRLRDYGIAEPDASPDYDDLHTFTVGNDFPLVCTYVEQLRPPVLILDPTIEVELLMGVRDENRSDQVARMFRDLRNLARASRTALLMPHHTARADRGKTQHIRGSTAFEGSVDGWMIVGAKEAPANSSGEQKTSTSRELTLDSIHRAGGAMRLPFMVDFARSGNRTRIQVTATGAPEMGALPEFSSKAKSAAKKPPAEPTAADLRTSLLLTLYASESGMSKAELKTDARVGYDKLQPVVLDLQADELIVKKGGKGKWELSDKGRGEVAKIKQRNIPQDIDDLIGTDDPT